MAVADPQGPGAPGERTYFAAAPKGLADLLAAELRAFGAAHTQETPGGVHFSGSLEIGYRACLWSRVASSVLLELATFEASTPDELYAGVRTVKWNEHVGPEATIACEFTATASPITHSHYATLRAKDAIVDQLRDQRGSRPSVELERPDVRVHVHAAQRNVTVSIDLAGESLHRRGYRERGVAAPLKENLAAGIVQLAGWNPAEPLLDPMCGSGTIVIEAAMMALAIPPGHARAFGFERLAGFDRRRWSDVREAALAARIPARRLPIFARDRYGEELKKARANLQAAGLADCVELKQADVLDTGAPAATGVLIANPPYGARLGEDAALAEFYPKLGDTFKKYYAGWRCCIFSADTRLPKLIRLSASRRTPLFNGPLECRLYEYRMVAGSNRKQPG